MGLCPFSFYFFFKPYCHKPFNTVYHSCYFIFHPGLNITALVLSVDVQCSYVNFFRGHNGPFFVYLYLSNNEKMQIPARVRSIGLIFFLVLFTFNTQNFFNRSTYSSGTRSEVGTDTSLIYHGLMSPHILVLIGVLIVALFCVVKMTEGFKGSLIKNVDS